MRARARALRARTLLSPVRGPDRGPNLREIREVERGGGRLRHAAPRQPEREGEREPGRAETGGRGWKMRAVEHEYKTRKRRACAKAEHARERGRRLRISGYILKAMRIYRGYEDISSRI